MLSLQETDRQNTMEMHMILHTVKVQKLEKIPTPPSARRAIPKNDLK